MSELASILNAAVEEETFFVDFDNVDSVDFSAPLPAGNYSAVIESVEKGRTKDGTKDKLHWIFRVTEKVPGKHIHLHADLVSGPGLRRNRQVLEAVGVGQRFTRSAVVGKPVLLIMGEPEEGRYDNLIRVKAAASSQGTLPIS
jgi:hypothetical protein